MSETLPKKTNCLKCKPFWIAISLGVIGSVFIGFAVFDQSFYGDNIFIFGDLFRFGILAGLLLGSSIGSYTGLKGYCFDGMGWDYLTGGIVFTLGSIAVIMVLIYFVPMAYDESVIRSLPDLDAKKEFAANKMNCNSILWNDDRASYTSDYDFELEFNQDWSSGFTLRGDDIDRKVKECRNK